MKLVLIALIGETLEGSYHLYSPAVPGFHVIEANEEKAYKHGVKILEETLQRRANEVGHEIRLHTPVEVDGFIPGEVKRYFDRNERSERQMRPTHLVAEIR
jgi:hypothetical protein